MQDVRHSPRPSPLIHDPCRRAVVEAERALLAATLRRPACVAEARGLLAATDFYSDAHQRIYAVLLDLAADGGPVDVATVAVELTRRGWLDDVGGFDAIAALAASFGSPAAVTTYARAVLDAARRRRLRLALGTATRQLDDGAAVADVLCGLQARTEPAATLWPEPVPASRLRPA